MLTVVSWLWHKPSTKHGVHFTAKHVNKLAAMVRKHLHVPYEFVCVCDDPHGLHESIRPVQLWDYYAELGGCYRRLYAFHEDAAEILGKRILSIDLDCVIVDDITPLVMRDENLVLWKAKSSNCHFNGSMWLHSPGTMTSIWHDFHPGIKELTNQLRIVGSDQAWLHHHLGPNVPAWTPDDGVMAFKKHCVPRKPLPSRARILFFPGVPKPWDMDIIRHYKWLNHYYHKVDTSKVLTQTPAPGYNGPRLPVEHSGDTNAT